MKLFISSLVIAMGMGATAIRAQDPALLPEPGFPIPAHLHAMPAGVARQIQLDMERANLEMRRMMAGLPAAPSVMPAAFRHSQETSYSCTNGAFTLQHRVNGVRYKLHGVMSEGRPILNRASIQDGPDLCVCSDLEDVPASHKVVVRNLLKQIAD